MESTILGGGNSRRGEHSGVVTLRRPPVRVGALLRRLNWVRATLHTDEANNPAGAITIGANAPTTGAHALGPRPGLDTPIPFIAPQPTRSTTARLGARRS